MKHRLHTHPKMEQELGVDENHVIIDLDVFLAVMKILGPNFIESCNCSWNYVTGESPNYFCGKCGKPMKN